MNHEVFGKLKYNRSEKCWKGYAPLPAFAAMATKPRRRPKTKEELEQEQQETAKLLGEYNNILAQRLSNMGVDLEMSLEGNPAIKKKVEKQLKGFEAMLDVELANLENEPEEPPLSPLEQERERKREEKEKKHKLIIAKGEFPIHIADETKEGPSAAQVTSFQYLMKEQQSILKDAKTAILKGYQDAFKNEDCREVNKNSPVKKIDELMCKFCFTYAELSGLSKRDKAYIVLHLYTEWADGACGYEPSILCHPDEKAKQVTFYDLDQIRVEQESEERAITPADELYQAILSAEMGEENQEQRIRELRAQGVDINELIDEYFSPLHNAVEQQQVNVVRRLLECGANPNATHKGKKQTPLKLLMSTYKGLGFLAKTTFSGPWLEMKTNMDEIKSLLEAAGGK